MWCGLAWLPAFVCRHDAAHGACNVVGGAVLTTSALLRPAWREAIEPSRCFRIVRGLSSAKSSFSPGRCAPLARSERVRTNAEDCRALEAAREARTARVANNAR